MSYSVSIKPKTIKDSSNIDNKFFSDILRSEKLVFTIKDKIKPAIHRSISEEINSIIPFRNKPHLLNERTINKQVVQVFQVRVTEIAI